MLGNVLLKVNTSGKFPWVDGFSLFSNKSFRSTLIGSFKVIFTFVYSGIKESNAGPRINEFQLYCRLFINLIIPDSVPFHKKNISSMNRQ